MKKMSRLIIGFASQKDRENLRIPIKSFHQFILRINNIDHEVNNISLTGIGFKINPALHCKLGESLTAQLIMNKQKFNLSLIVKHNSNNYVGAKLISQDENFVLNLMKILESEFSALSLRKIDAKVLKADENGKPHWFYGNPNHEIYFTTKNDLVTSFQINYHGQIIIAENDKIHVGIQIEEDRAGEHKTSNLVSGKVKLEDELKLLILRFVSTVDGIEPVFKQQILRRLSEYFKVSLGHDSM